MQDRVLFFSPYSAWKYHTALEVTWAHALKLRGMDVKFVLCNGLSGTCDVYRENLNPRGKLTAHHPSGNWRAEVATEDEGFHPPLFEYGQRLVQILQVVVNIRKNTNKHH